MKKQRQLECRNCGEWETTYERPSTFWERFFHRGLKRRILFCPRCYNLQNLEANGSADWREKEE